jgi:hypothetical protein
MNYYSSMCCYHTGPADFNLLFLLFLKELTPRRKSVVVPEEVSVKNLLI